MTSLDNKLHDWVVNELNLLSEGRTSRIPEPSTLIRLITTGKNKRLWNFFVNNVRAQSTSQKIRRVLKAKHAEEARERNIYLEPVCLDPSSLHHEISKSDEKCTFLKSSLSETTERVQSTEQIVRELRNEIDKLKQQSAFLETFIRKYKEKILLLKSLKDRLASERFMNAKKVKNSHNFAVADPGLNYLIRMLSSVVKKELKQVENVDTSIECITKIIDQKAKSTLLAELIFKLGDLSKTSYRNILKDMVYFSEMEMDEHDEENIPLPQKQLEDMKVQHVHSVILIKKMRTETEKLQNAKKYLVVEKMESLMTNTYTPSLERKYELLEKVLENKCIEESIKRLEMFLCEVQNNTIVIREKNNCHASISENLKIVIQKFYQHFDLLCQLLKWAPCTFKGILELSSGLYKFANKDMFTVANSQSCLSELKNNLSSEVNMFWNVCERNDVIKPSMHNPLPQTHSELALWSMAQMQQFHNTIAVALNIKQVKEKVHGNKKVEFLFDAEKSVSACNSYGAMLNLLQEMQTEIEAGAISLGKCSKINERTMVAICDWWQQDAQYIEDLSYGDKTLKMWQDILKTLSDFCV